MSQITHIKHKKVSFRDCVKRNLTGKVMKQNTIEKKNRILKSIQK